MTKNGYFKSVLATVIGFIFISLPLTGFSQVSFRSAKQDLGPNINTDFDEVKPVVSADCQMLYFARQNFPGNYGGKSDDQDIYVTHYNGNGWEKSEKLGSPLNDGYANGISSISDDGSTLLVFNGNTKGGNNMPGGMISKQTSIGWSKPQRINIKNFYNSNRFEDYQWASNNLLIMSVERMEGYGDQDLYISFREADGWSSPVNLGPTINTERAEYSPFLTDNGETLYFASEGHNGMGGADIYYSKRLDESYRFWSKPINLGSKVNSPADDAYFTIDKNKEFGYFVSSERGNRDIYRIALSREGESEMPFFQISGRVLDIKTKEPVQGEIHFLDASSGHNKGFAMSDVSGLYEIDLAPNKSYAYKVKASGYLTLDENVDLVVLENGQTFMEKDLFLTPIEKGRKVNLSNIRFERGKADLLPESAPSLKQLIEFMELNPTVEIELGGHTDNRGNPKANVQLSLRRVKTVEEYLVEKGINKKRMTTKGYGGSRPMASNSSEETRQLNRRVEITILKK